MSVKVRLPSSLRPYAAGAPVVEVAASTVGEAVEALVLRHSTLRPHLLDEAGRVRGFVTLYLNREDVRSLQSESTPVAPGDVLIVLPSVAGGKR